MRIRIGFLALAAGISTGFLFLFPAAVARADITEPVRSALNDLQSWLQAGSFGEGWNAYLGLLALGTEVEKGKNADPEVVKAVLKKLDSGAAGLELARFVRLRDALGQWSEDLVIAKAPDLPAAALSVESDFRPVGEADVEEAKAELNEATAKLDQALVRWGANGKGWKAYLRWQDLEEQLKSDSPDLDTLKSVHQQFKSNENGLEMPVFGNVATALDRYVNAISARGDDVPTQYVERLKDLAEKLKQYQDAKFHSEEIARAMGADLGWLQNMRQAPALLRAVRARYSKENVHVEISRRLVVAGIDRSVDDVAPINDSVQGTNVSGKGHTVGSIATFLMPDDGQAKLETKFAIRTNSRTVGSNGQVTVNSQGLTDVSGGKQFTIDETGFTSEPATTTATTKSQIKGIAAADPRGQQIATDRVNQNKPQAEKESAQNAAARARRRLDKEGGERIGEAQANYLRKFRNPLLRLGEFPSLLRFSTTRDSLFVTALQADRNQIGASDEPPSIAAANDMALRIHETAANNLLAALLSGTTMKEKEFQDFVIDWRGELPENLESEEDRPPWAITFSKSRPVIIRFKDDGVQITVRGTRYTSGERDVRAMNVTADYKIKPFENSFRLVRDEELHIVPPNFVPGESRLSTQQVANKALLQRKFGRVFEREIKSETLELSGEWEKAGPLDLKEIQSSSGWLVMAWLQNMTPTDAPKEKVAKVAN